MSNIIYKITNKVNAKIYIGKTSKSAQERLNRHFYNSKTQNTHLYNAMRKYGTENFHIEIIEETDSPNEREIFWIETLNPDYNMTRGGDGGDTSKSPTWIEGMKHRKVDPQKLATYGMLGKQHPGKGKPLTRNYRQVICEGVEYPSIGHAQKAYPGISIRRRLDNPNYPEFYRVKDYSNVESASTATK